MRYANCIVVGELHKDGRRVNVAESRAECIMKLLRRQFLQGALAPPPRRRWRRALAQADYPSRPVHILVGYAAGGVSDILARLIAKQLSDRLGQPFIVENRPGAGGNLAADQVVHAAPDGYTLLLAGMANAINVSLFPDLDFNFARDMAPVAAFATSPMVMEVNPSFPAKTVPAFIAYAKAHPGEIAMGSAGTGGSTHVAGELFQMLTGTKFTHVPYHGSAPALGRSARWPAASDVRQSDLVAGFHPCRQANGSGVEHVDRCAARRAADQRLRSGLRGLFVERHHRAERLPAGGD